MPVAAEHLFKSLYTGAKLLIVDDNEDLLKLLGLRLKPYGLELQFADSGEAALSMLEHFSPDLVITDLKMPGMSGLELFEQIHLRNPITPVIILTAHGTIAEAVEATQSGVASYVSKPFDSQDLLKKIGASLSASGFNKKKPSEEVVDNLDIPSLAHKSAPMAKLMHETQSHAVTDNLILIEGAPGVAKNQFAQYIHSLSLRKEHPVKQISCASLPQDVLSHELYGYVGQGTEDFPENPGLLRQSHKGTFILSDYDHADNDFVQKLLTAILEKHATYIDGTRSYPVDVRFIATTNVRVGSNRRSKKLLSDVQLLNGTVLRIPSLDERREDIPLIANLGLKHLSEKPDMQFSGKAIQVLLQAHWPGNARHLLNVVQQCALLSTTRVISDTLVKSRLNNPLQEIPPLNTAQRDFERDYLTNILKLTSGNVTKASEIAKRNRTEFHRLLKKHQIQAQSFRNH